MGSPVTGFLHIARIGGDVDPVNAVYRIAFAPLDGSLRGRQARCEGLDSLTDFLRQAGVPISARPGIVALAILSAIVIPTMWPGPFDWEFSESTWLSALATARQTFFLSFLPDYVSLLKTRLVLGWMRSSRSSRVVALLVGLDLLLTTGIAVGAVYLWMWYTMPEPYVASMFTRWLRVAVPLRSEAAIWFYATFLTSFWLWLYVFAGTTIKVANNLGLVVRRCLPPLDRGRAPEVGSAV